MVYSQAVAAVADGGAVTPRNAGGVLVAAGNQFFHPGVGGAAGGGAAGAGAAALGVGGSVPVATLATTAVVGANARLTAPRNVEVAANASEDVLSIALAWPAAGGRWPGRRRCWPSPAPPAPAPNCWPAAASG